MPLFISSLLYRSFLLRVGNFRDELSSVNFIALLPASAAISLSVSFLNILFEFAEQQVGSY